MYNDIKIDWISQWIISHLTESETWESTSSISAALTVYDGVTDNKVRRRLRKLRNAGVIIYKQEERENIANANYYQTNSTVTTELDDISRAPIQMAARSDIQKKIDKTQQENNHIKSEHRELKSETELLQNQLDEVLQQLGRVKKKQGYLMEHARVTETHLHAATELYEEHDIDFDDYLRKIQERI